MNPHVQFALLHPVFDPMTQIVGGHFWFYNRRIHAGLTCNIGME
jgi:hypothetical protein